jgi:HSP20 family protein
MATQVAAGLAPAKVLREMMTDPFDRFRQRFNRLYGETVVPFAPFNEENWSIASWSPACDIYETDSEIVVKTELPGVKKENVHVTLENNVLTIRGERKFQEEAKKENYHRVESNYGEFMRSFALPAFIDANKIDAEFKVGLLYVTLGKREESKPKQVEVKVK